MSNDDPSSWLMKVSLIIWTPQLHEFFLIMVSAADAMVWVWEASGVRWNSIVDDVSKANLIFTGLIEVTPKFFELSPSFLEMLECFKMISIQLATNMITCTWRSRF
ncbi:hypothetical protein HN51_059384 [Arachis hypogaea]